MSDKSIKFFVLWDSETSQSSLPITWNAVFNSGSSLFSDQGTSEVLKKQLTQVYDSNIHFSQSLEENSFFELFTFFRDNQNLTQLTNYCSEFSIDAGSDIITQSVSESIWLQLSGSGNNLSIDDIYWQVEQEPTPNSAFFHPNFNILNPEIILNGYGTYVISLNATNLCNERKADLLTINFSQI